MIARYPGVIPPGRVDPTPSYFADWFPTLCEAAKVSKQDLSQKVNLDGVSLWPALTGSKPLPERPAMVWVFPEYSGQVALRWDDYKLLRRGLATKNPSNWELYDLSSDPQEAVDLSAKYPELVQLGLKILKEQSDHNEVFPVSF
jgi:arylsulfatase A-like enzyme